MQPSRRDDGEDPEMVSRPSQRRRDRGQRMARIRQGERLDFHDAGGSAPGGAPPHIDVMRESWCWTIVDRAVMELPEPMREVVLHRDYLGASWPVATNAVGAPSEQAAQELHYRAWIRLRRALRERLSGLR